MKRNSHASDQIPIDKQTLMNPYFQKRCIIALIKIDLLCISFFPLIQNQTLAQSKPEDANTVMVSQRNFEQGNITLAIQKWGRDIRTGKNVAQALYNRSQAFILLKQYEFAVKDLDQLLKIQENKVPAEVYIVRGIALTETNQLSDAIKSFNQAEQIQRSPLVYNNRALAYERQGQLNLALIDLSKSVQLAPTPTHRLNLASLQNQLGQYNQVIQGMNLLIIDNTQFFPAYLTRGIAHYNLGQFQEAIQDFLFTLKIQPEQPEAYYYAGLSFAQLNRKEDATQNLVKAANLYLKQNQSNFYYQIIEKMTELDLQ